jgi:indolepyruvate ferredoxin oxidoreductase alpha subunit
MLMVRIRSCHVTGSFTTKDNSAPLTVRRRAGKPAPRHARIVLPPASFLHEKDKIRSAGRRPKLHPQPPAERDSSARRTACRHHLPGRHVQRRDPRAAAAGPRRSSTANTDVPLYVLNVDLSAGRRRVPGFCEGKEQVLVVEEGQPNYIEQALAPCSTRPVACGCVGKDVLPMAGEYTGEVMLDGIGAFLREAAPRLLPAEVRAPNKDRPPIFPTWPRPCRSGRRASAPAARTADLRRDQAGASRNWASTTSPPTSAAICSRSCRPSRSAATTMGYGLGPARPTRLQLAGREKALDLLRRRRRLLAQRPDLVDRQRRVQQERRRHRDRRQLLFGRDRRAGHPVLARRNRTKSTGIRSPRR